MRRYRFGAIAALTLALVVSACGSSGTKATSASGQAAGAGSNTSLQGGSGNTTGSVVLGATADANVSAQAVVASAEHLFSKYHVNVSIRYFPTAGALAVAMEGGSIQMGVGGTVPLTKLRASGTPIVVLSELANISGAQFIVAGKGITDASQLAGKQMGVALGTVEQLLEERFLAEHNLLGKVGIVNFTSGPALLTALENGNIAAATLWQPLETSAEQAGFRPLASGTKEYTGSGTSPKVLFSDHAVLVAKKAWLANNSGLAEGVVRALIDANRLMQSDPTSTQASIASATHFSPEALKNTFADNSYQVGITAGLISGMNGEAQFLLQKQEIHGSLSASSWIDTSVLKAIDPGLVSAGA